jgi:hypothetical protein
MRNTLLAATAALALAAGQAQAAYVINAVQSGGNVVLTGSGSIDLGSFATVPLLAATSGFMDPADAFNGGVTGSVVLGSGFADTYGAFGSGPLFGPGGLAFPSTVTGDLVGVFSSGSIDTFFVFLPAGYQSGHPISSSATFTGATFASLGMTPGTYTWTWSADGGGRDSLTLNINATAVPAPAALSLLGLGLAGLLLARRRG